MNFLPKDFLLWMELVRLRKIQTKLLKMIAGDPNEQ